MPVYLHVRSVSFRFSPVRYLRFCFQFLTASRLLATSPFKLARYLSVPVGGARFDDAPPHHRNKAVPIVAVARRQNQSFLGAVGVKQRVSALDSGFLLYESRIDQQTREPEFGARGRNWRQFFSGVCCLTGGRERFDEEELCL